MTKTASGTVLHNSSPAAIEQFLVNDVKEALGEYGSAVKIKPYLQIDKEDQDLSGNVKNAFGAIELNIHGSKLYLPFIIADKTLLPFDTIRMGSEETAYDYSKLRKLVVSIENKAKSQGEDGDKDNPFKTMEVADFKDIQPNNGFLGNIMAVRDMARQRDSRGDYPWSGSEFGVVSDERLQKQASKVIDVFDVFHDVMEKIANVKSYSQKQIDEFESHIRKQANAEEMEGLEKTAAGPTMEEARVRRDMTQLAKERLVDVRRAASGNDISFPIFCDGRLEYISGRVYSNFRSWFPNEKKFTSGKVDTFVLDSKGNFKLLKGNEPFMISVREPNSFNMATERVKSMGKGELYLIEDSPTTAFNPFVVRNSYLEDQLNNGMLISVREESFNRDFKSRTNNTLFSDQFRCEEVVPGKYNGESFTTGAITRSFQLIISKDPTITKPTFMTSEELKNYITQNAKDMADASLARQIVDYYEESNILVPADLEVFIAKKQIEGYYTKPDGMIETGPMAKEASFDNLNKARLVVLKDRGPKSYSVQWQYADPADAGGVSAKRLKRHSVDNVSKDSAKSMLQRLGFDYRTTAQFFEIADRTGRQAIFSLPDVDKASKVAPEKVADDRVKKKTNSLANNMLHSQNFLPHLANTIGDGLSIMLSEAVPGSVNVANKMSNSFGFGKQSSFETAQAIEKVASKINGNEWHEISALLNMKYRLDKLAGEIADGNYLHNAEPVFAKVAELRPVIEKKASDLIDFNRKQLIRTSSYIIEPSLIKQAVHQLDELAVYASDVKKNETLNKEAGIFREGSKLSEATQKATDLNGNLTKLKNSFDSTQAKLRAKLHPDYKGDKLNHTVVKAKESENAYREGSEEYQKALREKGEAKHKEAKKNVAIAAGVGIPGLAGLGYTAQSERNKKKD